MADQSMINDEHEARQAEVLQLSNRFVACMGPDDHAMKVLAALLSTFMTVVEMNPQTTDVSIRAMQGCMDILSNRAPAAPQSFH